MFTIKATYRNETRKYTFPDTNTFPPYHSICIELRRIFSIIQPFHLSKLQFSPDASSASRILIGKEVRSSHDYHRYIRQFKDRSWPNALLRLTICDDIIAPYGSLRSTRDSPSHLRHASMSHIPVATPSTFQYASGVPMDVEPPAPTLPHIQRHHYRPQYLRPPPQHRMSAPAMDACCSVSQGKADIQAMLTNFEKSLNSVLENNLGVPLVYSLSAPQRTSNGMTESAPPPSLCSMCITNISSTEDGQKVWYSCTDCHIVVCKACHERGRPGFCLSVMGPHNMQLESGRQPGPAIPHLPTPWATPASMPNPPIAEPAACSPRSDRSDGLENPGRNADPAPVVHTGVWCDACRDTIQGVRHKCLDCPDYDLCTACISAGSAERHNPFHEFFELKEPGRVVVHTVFSGRGEREGLNSAHRAPVREASVESHSANCDLCDSRIQGDRYKCVVCPDFDTCNSCFSITEEQHPHHPFVRISKRADYIRARAPPSPMHYATCDGCQKTIFGVRYKCMHPECPDYDLCANCEALPIPVHPDNHPLLKMKAPETVIPTVYRVGQSTLIPRPEEVQTTPKVNSQNVNVETRASPPPVLPAPFWYESTPPASRPRSPAEEERIKTPTASSVPLPSVKPPIPPKPKAMLYQPWDFTDVLKATNDALRATNEAFTADDKEFVRAMEQELSRMTNRHSAQPPATNPFADMPPTMPAVPVPASVEVEQPEVTLPSVPRHIPNPWPTTNPAERQELLQLIADFAGPSTSQSVLDAIPDLHYVQQEPVMAERQSLMDRLSALSAPEDKSLLEPVLEQLEHVAVAEAIQQNEDDKVLLERAADLVRTNAEADLVLLERLSSGLQTPSTVPSVPSPAEPQTTNNENAPAPVAEPLVIPQSSQSAPWSVDFSSEINHLLEGIGRLEETLRSGPRSSVSEEPLVNRSVSPNSSAFPALSQRQSLADLIDELPTLVPRSAPEPVSAPAPEPRVALSASFVEDVTVSDGQVFPPGAEFVKCWRLLNDSARDWPESTQLVFVAGETLTAEKDKASSMVVEVGKVASGAEADIWTGELKAPDAPGRYVGYWRLKADGELFGNSLWIEINVVESDSHHSSGESMAASSIIMPTPPSVPHTEHPPSLTAHTHSTETTSVVSTATEDNMSDAGSDISLISMPSSSEDEDEALWHDTRSQATAELAAAGTTRANASPSHTSTAGRSNSVSAMDYVLLYDDNSEDE
ncbi:unnamed protein product [Cyclocybe aegerita]|uniref:ZZ-type domain-containing protein n=1 Tax=Cyclocybe aegerita TaxID=1973307 RepID=A0A8S0VRU7_CYCAE|nr:unnamed protein product [Cyclocybe aegerita]